MSDTGNDRDDGAPPWPDEPDKSDSKRRRGRRGRRRDPNHDGFFGDGDPPPPDTSEPMAGTEFVDLPSWADDTTRAADDVESEGFDGGPLVRDTPPASPVASDDTDPTDVLTLDPAAYAPAQDQLFAGREASPQNEPVDEENDWLKDEALVDWPDPEEGARLQGLATPDPLASLMDDEDDEDHEDWDSFARASSGPHDEVSDRAEPPKKLSRRERRQARKAQGAQQGDETVMVDQAPGGWVVGDPAETAWLAASDEGDESDESDDTDLMFEPPPPILEEPLGSDESDGSDDPESYLESDGSPEEPEMPVAPPDRQAASVRVIGATEETVWLAADQPLVGAPAEPVVRHAEQVEDWDDADADEWFAEANDGDDAWVDEYSRARGVNQPAVYDAEDDQVEITDVYASAGTMEHRGLAEDIFRASEEDLEWQAMSASMPGVGSGVVGFDDVADLGDDDQEILVTRARSDVSTRVLTGLILFGLLLGSMWVGPEAFGVFVGLMVMVALGEYYTALRRHRYRPLALFGYLGGAGTLLGAWYHGPLAIPVALCLTAVVTYFVFAFIPLGRHSLTNGGLTVLGVVWITGSAAFAFPLVRSPGFQALVITIVATTAAMDIGAFGIGRMMGSRSLAPLLSPNKSVEGLVGGIVATFAVAAGMSFVFEEISLSHGLWVGLVVSVLAPFGDLAESMIKRSLGIKDMGAILPGHGGVLDRIDAFLFVLPAAWVLFKVTGLIG